MMRLAPGVAIALALAADVALAQTPNGGGPGPVLGIVEIPAIFASDPQTGVRIQSGELRLYTAPDRNGEVAASLSLREAIDDAEYGYEEAGALVYGRERGYYLIRTARGTAWLSPDDAGRFHSLEMLVSSGLAHATEAWDRFLSTTPAGTVRTRVGRQREYGAESVKVTATRTTAGQLWLRVDVMTHSYCESNAPPKVRASGWLKAHDAAGAPTVWFSSRGC
jgi:hypothetical protein